MKDKRALRYIVIITRTMEGIKGPGLIIEEYSINETTLGNTSINLFIKKIVKLGIIFS